jgi:hypothetical protein
MWHNLWHHLAQFKCFNWMVEKKNEIFIWHDILKNPNDATCHIFRLPHVNILVCIVVTNVITRTHIWIHV